MMDKKLSVSEHVEAGNSWYVAEHKDQINTPGTREIVEKRWAAIQHTLTMMKDRNKLKHKFKILDAGCGDGNNLIGLQMASEKLNLDLEVVAVDYNPLRVKRVKDRGLAEKVLCADLLQLPFPAHSFDLIICNQVLEHIPDFMGALNGLHTVIKYDGLMLLGVPNEGCFLARLRNNVLQRSILRNTDHVNFFDAVSLSKHAQQAGFSVESIFRAGFFTPHFYLHMFLMKIGFFRKILFSMGKIFPSQSADLQLLLFKH